jgi:hypothetical protein
LERKAPNWPRKCNTHAIASAAAAFWATRLT